MPGGGKSTVGRLVARRLGIPFADVDKEVEQAAGRTIAAIFAGYGEETFRELESEVLARLVGDGPSVVATGGGAVIRARNRDLLRSHSHCVYLHVPTYTLMSRLRRDTRRPLMQVADPKQRLLELLAEREPLYEATAAVVVHTAGLPLERVVGKVIADLRTWAPTA